MTYELAKELKDAGFPQYGREVMTPTTADITKNRESVYYPTLSELIEICGEDLIALYHSPRVEHEPGWAAVGKYWHYGSTPEEAVAKLWIALNKK